MAIREVDVLMRSIDGNNDSIISYPATRKDNVIDLEEASSLESGLMSADDKSKLDDITYKFGSDSGGIYIESLV